MTSTRRRPASAQHWYQQLWHSQLFLLGLIMILGLLLTATIREGMNRVQLNKEIALLESNIVRLQGRNTDMIQSIARLNSSAEQDKAARTKLGVQQPGEQVVLFPQSEADSVAILETTELTIPVNVNPVDVPSNPERWFYYFFHPQSEVQSL